MNGNFMDVVNVEKMMRDQEMSITPLEGRYGKTQISREPFAHKGLRLIFLFFYCTSRDLL
ncbi:MAG TPA: hypothetical protein VN379_21725 [Sporomusa sp.]|nr:hypothetical protein [Sporomusa sp.]